MNLVLDDESQFIHLLASAAPQVKIARWSRYHVRTYVCVGSVLWTFSRVLSEALNSERDRGSMKWNALVLGSVCAFRSPPHSVSFFHTTASWLHPAFGPCGSAATQILCKKATFPVSARVEFLPIAVLYPTPSLLLSPPPMEELNRRRMTMLKLQLCYG